MRVPAAKLFPDAKRYIAYADAVRRNMQVQREV